MFDYVTIDIPQEQAERVRAISGVISVAPERPVKALYVPTAIDKKLSEFQRLFFSNPITGPPSAFSYAIKADEGKKRVPTSESRKMIGADIAEQEGITGKGIKVAVLDTGTNYDFLFSGPYHEGSKSSIEGQPVPLDEVGHGSHVQATISGRPFQTIHGLIKGVAVDAQVAAFKCLGGGLGVGMTSWILRAMADMVEWGADIVNMSLGGDDEDYTTSPYHRIISGLTKQGIIFCIAAGNSGPQPNTIGSPGSMPDSLTVGAVSYPDGKICEFSSRGPTLNGLIKPDCVAPGQDILTTSSGYIAAMQFMDGPPSLAAISGTSMACVTGDTIILGVNKVFPIGRHRNSIKRVLLRVPIVERRRIKTQWETAFWTYSGIKPVIEIKTSYRNLKLTEDHFLPVLPAESVRARIPVAASAFSPTGFQPLGHVSRLVERVVEMPALSLKVGDYLLVKDTLDIAGKDFPRLQHLTEEAWQCLGFFLAEGSLAKNQIFLSQTHDKITKYYRDLFSKVFLVETHTHKNKGFYINSAEVARIIRDTIYNDDARPGYRTRKRKLLSLRVLNLPNSKIAAFLRGYFDGDGWFVSKEKQLGFADKKAVLERIKIALLRFGIRSTLPKGEWSKSEINGKIVIGKGKGFTLRVTGSSVDKYSDRIGFGAKNPQFVGLRSARQKGIKPACRGYEFERIISIRPRRAMPVYDFTCPQHQHFIANGIVLHNCPHASGTVALALQYARSKGKNLTADHIKEALDLWGDYPGGAKNSDYGWGLITYQLLKRYVDEKLT
jgi:intein/homing endonuclease